MSDSVENRVQAPLEMEWSAQADTFVQLSTAIAQLEVVRHAFTTQPGINGWESDELEHTKISRKLDVHIYGPHGNIDRDNARIIIVQSKINGFGKRYETTIGPDRINLATIHRTELGSFISDSSPQDMLDRFAPHAKRTVEEMREPDIMSRHAAAAYKYAQKHLLSGEAFLDLF